MAEFLHFSRDSRMFVVSGTGANTRAWSIPVLDGFSFSQATNASEITLGEMEDASGRSRRGRKMFTDSLSAAEFSFSTYARPFVSGGSGGAGMADSAAEVHAVEEILWLHMAGQNEYQPATYDYNNAAVGGAITSITESAETLASTTDGTYTFTIDKNNMTTGASTLAATIATGDVTMSNASPNFDIPGAPSTHPTLAVGAVITGTNVPAATTIVSIAANGSNTRIVMSANASGAAGGTSYTFDNPTAANAVVSVTVASNNVTAFSVTERGIGFRTGDKIVLAGSAMGSGSGTVVYDVVSKSINVGNATNGTSINFFDSNRSSIGEFDVYFILGRPASSTTGRLVYRLSQAVINEASVDFDIDGIATINWSGMSKQITDVTPNVDGTKSTGNNVQAKPFASAASVTSLRATEGGYVPGDIYIETDNEDAFYVGVQTGNKSKTTHFVESIREGTTETTNFIRNRLTQLTLVPDADFAASYSPARYVAGGYNIPITSGNITISNNITFLTPEELGKVNQPLRHVTGTRTVTGSVSCYLGSSDAATNRSKDLFEHLVTDINTVINKFSLTFDVGGTTSKPRLSFTMPLCHLEIPSHSIEDVVALETNFHALGSTVGESDEVTLSYHGNTL